MLIRFKTPNQKTAQTQNKKLQEFLLILSDYEEWARCLKFHRAAL